MNIETYGGPCRHFVIDNYVAPAGDWSVPPASDPIWEAQYDSDVERGKRTTRETRGWSAEVVRRMLSPTLGALCGRTFGEPMAVDALLWGGGLQVTAPGGVLAPHLDGVRHPQRPGLRRAAQMVCFCHPVWREEWGGEFAFFTPTGDVWKVIEPVPGRLLVFENTDLSYHGVLPVRSIAAERVSVSCSLLAPSRPEDTRARALFMPFRAPRYASPPDNPPS